MYNPIFEEEIDKSTRKKEFRQLKKAISKRAKKSHLRSALSRVYNLLKNSPISTWFSLEEDLVKSSK